jgi:hypothetical protein
MTASPLSISLSTLLRGKAIKASEIGIFSDNAKLPTDDLIERVALLGFQAQLGGSSSAFAVGELAEDESIVSDDQNIYKNSDSSSSEEEEGDNDEWIVKKPALSSELVQDHKNLRWWSSCSSHSSLDAPDRPSAHPVKKMQIKNSSRSFYKRNNAQSLLPELLRANFLPIDEETDFPSLLDAVISALEDINHADTSKDTNRRKSSKKNDKDVPLPPICSPGSTPMYTPKSILKNKEKYLLRSPESPFQKQCREINLVF